jgi:RNA polymerase sigma factor (sigma-70 family)
MLNETQKQLVTNNLGLVYNCAKKKHLLRDEDAIQYGFIGLCKAAERYNKDSNVKFSTFATSYIIRWLDGLYSDIKYRKRIRDGSLIISDEFELNTPSYELSEDKLFVKTIFNSVDKESKLILVMIYSGYSNKEIYTSLNLSSGKYYGKIKKIREKFVNERC